MKLDQKLSRGTSKRRTADLKGLPLPFDGPPASSFLDKIRHYPMLEKQEEYDLVTAWQTDKDERALDKLVTSHLRLVAKAAAGYRRYGLPMEDLISEGTIGLIQAIDRFDIERDFRLATYAKWWVRAGMQEYVMRSWSLVRVGTTLGQKKLFFNLRKMKAEICGVTDGMLPTEDVATVVDRLDVTPAEVETMDARMTYSDCSLNEMVNGEEGTQWQEFLVDERDDQEAVLAARQETERQSYLVQQALEDFPERDRRIFKLRRISEDRLTLHEIGEMFQISPERVRQIEHGIFAKLRATLVTDDNSATAA